MSDVPERIWAWISGDGEPGWDEADYCRGEEYIRVDASPETFAAIPAVQALIAAAVEVIVTGPPELPLNAFERLTVSDAIGEPPDINDVRSLMEDIRSLTPADAAAALDRMLQEAREEGAQIAMDDAGYTMQDLSEAAIRSMKGSKP